MKTMDISYFKEKLGDESTGQGRAEKPTRREGLNRKAAIAK